MSFRVGESRSTVKVTFGVNLKFGPSPPRAPAGGLGLQIALILLYLRRWALACVLGTAREGQLLTVCLRPQPCTSTRTGARRAGDGRGPAGPCACQHGRGPLGWVPRRRGALRRQHRWQWQRQRQRAIGTARRCASGPPRSALSGGCGPGATGVIGQMGSVEQRPTARILSVPARAMPRAHQARAAAKSRTVPTE